MRVKCLHGFFIFEEFQIGQVSDFMSLTGLALAPWRSDYSFEDLVDLPDFSLQGGVYGDFLATESFEGEPWEIFEANGLVYNFVLGVVVPIASVVQRAKIELAGNRYISPGLILPGSISDDGNKIKNYSAFYSRDTQRWLYSEVEYV